MIEVQTPYSFEDTDEVRRLENLSNFCKANAWEFYLACLDQTTLDLTNQKIEGRNIQAKAIWLVDKAPFVN